MTLGERAVSRTSSWAAAALAVVVLGATAGVALASSGAVVTSRDGSFGWMLTGRNGHALYLFHQDWGGKSYCYSTCAKVWTPDITYGRPTTPNGSGVNSKLLGTIRRRNGSMQVTYNGHPLYFFTGDSRAGTLHGEGKYQFGGYWYGVAPSGKAIKKFVPPGY